ncbi:tyrosine-protein kinase family protein [Chthonobacter rhizosphaerae]|uniref:tyrosine-protein kinase family protein n=1 Tax=Chthonobacter rhizosphaerae TaxID=2735553 RepID=UPI0015EFA43C|nr:tyrosine-protein kinase family protein [Chthonobacter rhizosphaerae]
MVIDRLGLRENTAFIESGAPSWAERFWRLRGIVSDSLAEYGLVGDETRRMLAGDGADTQATAPRGRPLTEFQLNRRAMAIFQSGLAVRRLGVSYAIEITFQSVDSDLAASIANALADAYVREQVEIKAAAANEGRASMERRLDQLRNQMNRAVAIAQAFRSRHDYRIGVPDASVDTAQFGTAGPPTLEELEVTAETYRKMYESFLGAYTDQISQQSLPAVGVRVITPATPALEPNSPKPKLVLSFSLLAGLLVGGGLAFLRHSLDKTVRFPRQIREEFGLDCIGELPRVFGTRGGYGRFDEVIRQPDSRFTQTIFNVKGMLALARVRRPARRIAVVSALPSDGKSTCASNLAYAHAVSGLKTLLIDADIYHAALSRRLARKVKAGSEAPGPEALRGAITTLRDECLWLLPSHALGPEHLLDAGVMDALLKEMTMFDVVIVDLPPLTAGVDRLAASALCDGVIVVAEWGRTPVDMVASLIQILHASDTTSFGVLLTKARTHHGSHGQKRWGTFAQ